jgi:hypothetical protein
MKTCKLWNGRCSAVAAVLTLVGMTVLSGCGGGGEEGPERYEVSGTVNYKTQPVASGTITFDPAPGNDAPQGYAPIVDGNFDTAAEGGKGVTGGQYNITVNAPGFKYTSPTPVDLPKEASKQHLDLKESDVTVVPITEGP